MSSGNARGMKADAGKEAKMMGRFFRCQREKEPVFILCGSGNNMPRPGSVEAADLMIRERIAVCRGGKKYSQIHSIWVVDFLFPPNIFRGAFFFFK